MGMLILGTDKSMQPLFWPPMRQQLLSTATDSTATDLTDHTDHSYILAKPSVL